MLSARPIALALGLAWSAGCSEGIDQWKAKLPDLSLPVPKGEKATLISELKGGIHQPSTLAMGEEKDLARQRGEGAGFVRLPGVERYLTEIRAKLIAVSGRTGVPGRVIILANRSFTAHSTADGNLYVSLGCLEDLESADEVAAVVAHEVSHVLLAHHSSDLIGDLQRRGRALYELWVSMKTAAGRSKKTSKGDAKGLDAAETVVRVTDKLLLPAWNRGQEREADLLGVDLLVEAGYSPVAMIGMLEKLRAWEKTEEEADKAFLARVQEASSRGLKETGKEIYKEILDRVSVNHPKTAVRIQETAKYLERHYGERTLAEPRAETWTALTRRPEVAEVMGNYKLAFSADAMLGKGRRQEAYVSAKKGVAGRTAGDAYPNLILARSADALGRQPEAVAALERAIRSGEPVSLVYTELVSVHERAGNFAGALDWANKASEAFAGAPQWQPDRIRLLRRTGRAAEAQLATMECSLKTPEWKPLCEKANRVDAPAVRPAR